MKTCNRCGDELSRFDGDRLLCFDCLNHTMRELKASELEKFQYIAERDLGKKWAKIEKGIE